MKARKSRLDGFTVQCVHFPFRLGLLLVAGVLLQSNAVHQQHEVGRNHRHPYSDPIPLQFVPVSQETPSTNLTIVESSDRLPHRLIYVLQSSQDWSVRISSSPRRRRLERPSVQTHDECHFATNGGPYNADGTAVGLVVIHGKVLMQGAAADEGEIGFGLSSDGSQWVMGRLFLPANTTSQQLVVQTFVTGFDWLVFRGENVAMFRNNTTGANKSARTAIGVDAEGRLLLVVADGCEKCLRNKGLTLSELSDVLIRHGALHAINMDGGGSSVLVQRHRGVLSRPTCLDLPWICERAVASVFCVGSNSRTMEDSVLLDS